MESKTAEEIYQDKIEGRVIFTQEMIVNAMEEYASIKLAEKDKEIAGLRYNIKKYAETVDHRNASILEYQDEIERLKGKISIYEPILKRYQMLCENWNDKKTAKEIMQSLNK